MVTKYRPGRAHGDRPNPPTCQLSTNTVTYNECEDLIPSPPCTDFLKAGIDTQQLMDVGVPFEYIKMDPYDDHLLPMFPTPGHDTSHGLRLRAGGEPTSGMCEHTNILSAADLGHAVQESSPHAGTSVPSLVSEAFERFLDVIRSQVDSSPFLKSGLDNLVSNFRQQYAEFRQRYVELVEEDRNLQAGLTCSDKCIESYNDGLADGSSDGEATVTNRQTVRGKRPLSLHDCPAKRRKSGVRHHDYPQLPDEGTLMIKDESNSDSEEEPDDADETVGACHVFEDIRIDDTSRVWGVIDARLRQMKQEHCKKVAKAWVKAKEPQKQSKYPYNGGGKKEESMFLFGDKMPGELTRPPWWCASEGWQQGDGCRHREPDHQKKPERLFFMKHMLSICPVSLLEESTMELRPSSKKCVWWSILEEIYGIRRKQQRFEHQEIDGGATIHVEVPPSALSPMSRSSIVGTDAKIRSSHPHSDRRAAATSKFLNLKSTKVEDPFPCFKTEAMEPAPALSDYPQRIPFDEAHNEMGDPNGNDMHFPISRLTQVQASDPRAARRSTTQTPGFRIYQPSYSSTQDNMLNGAETYSNLWAEVGDLSLNLGCEGADRPFAQGLPGRHLSSGLDNNCEYPYIFSSSLMSNPSEASLHQSSADSAGLDLQNTPRQASGSYANYYTHARGHNLDGTAPPSIDPRNLLLLEQHLR